MEFQADMILSIDLLKELVAALPDPVFILTESGRYAAVVGGTDPRYYHDGSHLVGLSIHDVIPEKKAGWFLEQIRHCLNNQCLHTIEYGLAGLDVEGLEDAIGPGGEIWFEGRIQPLSAPVDGERAVVWVARNITQRKNMEVELRRLSETDALTGIVNRRKLLKELDERFREFKRYERPSVLLILDLDHFKEVNDRFGHLVGDEVLRHIAQICQTQIRDVDLLARFGGEEFAVLLPNTKASGAQTTAERLCTSIAQTEFAAYGNRCTVTVSIGLSDFQPSDLSAEEVLKRADDALYEAKRNGRNQVVSKV